MKTFQKSLLLWAAVLVFGPACQGQVAQPGDTNTGPALTITGTVFDAAGSPAAGVRVSVTSGFGTNLEVRSRADGKYAVNWRKSNPAAGALPMIYARDLERNLALSQEVDETATNMDLRLQTGLTVSVKVRDVAGKPIPTATETLVLSDVGGAFHLDEGPSTADGQGLIEIRALPQELRYSARITANGYGSTNFFKEETETPTNHFDFPLAVLRRADRKIAGQVLGPDSKPVPGAVVRVQGEGQVITNTTTDARGHFAFDAVCEGSLRVYAQSAGLAGDDLMRGEVQSEGGNTNILVRFGVVSAARNGESGRLVTISGKVLDAAGSPVSGVRLTGEPSDASVSVTNDPDGKYSITWQIRQIPNFPNAPMPPAIYARDLARNLAVSQQFDETTTNLDLRLQPGLTLSFKVQDGNGAPIPSATGNLSVSFLLGTSVHSVSQKPSKADDQGVIKITALPQGLRYNMMISAKGYGSTNFFINENETQTTRLDVPTAILRVADRKLAGHVLGPDGKPAPGASVYMNSPGQPNLNATTDAKGYFSFDAVCEGPVRVNANKSGGFAGEYMNGDIEAQAGDTNVVVRFGVMNMGNGFRGRLVSVSGTVFDVAGTPVSGVLLSEEPYNTPVHVRNDPDGKYSITWQSPYNPGAPGTPALYARDLAHNQAVRQEFANTTTNLDLHLQPGLTLSVKVKDANGRPIPTATASFSLVSRNQGYVAFNPTPRQADDQGVIEISALAQALDYNASITAKGYGTASVQAPAGETQTNHFDFPVVVLPTADRQLAGKVVGPDSKPVPGVIVYMSGRGQPRLTATTDAKGHFAFEAVCEGPLQVSANGPAGFANYSATGDAQAQGGDTNVLVRLGVRNMGNGARGRLVTVSGTVLDASGAPVPGVRLTAELGNQRIQITNDPDGKYSITGQLQNNPGAASQPVIYARDLAHNLAVCQEFDDTTTNLDLHLQPGLTLSVKVQDANGKPIPAATASFSLMFGNRGDVPVAAGRVTRWTPISQTPIKADAQGVIEIKTLPQSLRYNLNITAKGYGTANMQTQAGETDTTHFDFPAVVLRPADRKIAGQVLGPDGKPVPEVNVFAGGIGQPNLNTTTDAQGHFAFAAVCEGSLQLNASGSGGAGAGFMNGNTQAQAGDTNIVVRLGISNFGNGPAARLVTISGRVLDASGAPVSGVLLSAEAANNTVHVTNDPDGKYSMTWQMQNFPNSSSMPAIYARDLAHNLAVRQEFEATATNLNLHLQPGLTLSVKVQDVNGKPIPTATAIFSLASGIRVDAVDPAPMKADAEGVIQMKTLPQALGYYTSITAQGYGSAFAQVQAEETQTNHFDFPVVVLRVADHKLAGQVLGIDGKPVPEASVFMNGPGQPAHSTTTDAEGRFAFEAVCEGVVNLTASNPNNRGQNFLQGRAQTRGGDTNVEIKLAPPAPVQAQPFPQIRPRDPQPYGMVAPSQAPPGVLNPQGKEIAGETAAFTAKEECARPRAQQRESASKPGKTWSRLDNPSLLRPGTGALRCRLFCGLCSMSALHPLARMTESKMA